MVAVKQCSRFCPKCSFPANTEGAAALAGFVATGSYGEVDDIARTVAFLARPDTSYITGAAIPVDGGLLA